MQLISTVIIIILVTFLVRHFINASKNTVPLVGGALVLKYPGFMAVIGYAVIAFGALIVIVTEFQIIPTTGNEVVPYLAGFFVVLGLPLVLIEKRVRAVVTEEKVGYTGLVSKYREIRWDQVREVRFSFTSEIVLSAGETRIKLNVILAGFEGFVEIMKRKLDPSLYSEALGKYEQTLANMERR